MYDCYVIKVVERLYYINMADIDSSLLNFGAFISFVKARQPRDIFCNHRRHDLNFIDFSLIPYLGTRTNTDGTLRQH